MEYKSYHSATSVRPVTAGLFVSVRVGQFAPKASGGDEGIRTLDELLAHTPLAGERLRPLGHVSERGISQLRALGQAANANKRN